MAAIQNNNQESLRKDEARLMADAYHCIEQIEGFRHRLEAIRGKLNAVRNNLKAVENDNTDSE